MAAPLTIIETVAAIRRRLEDSRFTDEQIAHAAGVAVGVPYYIRRGSKSPTVKTLEKIERGLNVLEDGHGALTPPAAQAAA